MAPGPVSRRRAFGFALSLVLVALLLFAPAALAGAVTPESGGSPNANRIDSLYKLVLVVAIVVFVGVEGTLIYSLLRFRVRKGRVAAQIRGNTSLEIGWTVGASVIVVVLTAISFAKLGAIKDPTRSGPGGLAAKQGVLYASLDQAAPPGGKKLNVKVNGQQYLWRYTYPNNAFAYDTMVVPVDTTVTLDIEAQDVVHSWWIPKLGGKFDAVPGYVNHTWFKITEPGVYEGQCAELCGAGHANMVARVRALPVDRYLVWVDRQKRLIDQANAAAASERAQFQPIPSR